MKLSRLTPVHISDVYFEGAHCWFHCIFCFMSDTKSCDLTAQQTVFLSCCETIVAVQIAALSLSVLTHSAQIFRSVAACQSAPNGAKFNRKMPSL